MGVEAIRKEIERKKEADHKTQILKDAAEINERG